MEKCMNLRVKVYELVYKINELVYFVLGSSFCWRRSKGTFAAYAPCGPLFHDSLDSLPESEHSAAPTEQAAKGSSPSFCRLYHFHRFTGVDQSRVLHAFGDRYARSDLKNKLAGVDQSRAHSRKPSTICVTLSCYTSVIRCYVMYNKGAGTESRGQTCRWRFSLCCACGGENTTACPFT